MAESSASSPIEKLGFEPLIHDKARVDPIATDSIHPSGSSLNALDASLNGKNIALHEEMELGNSIERELLRLTITQAEIEASDDKAQGKDVRPVKNEDVDEHNKKVGDYDEEENEGVEVGKDAQMSGGLIEEEKDVQSESTEQENENERGRRDFERLPGEEVAKFSIQNRSNNRRKINYPMRPDAEDCAYYMKFGSCKFGFSCKFNHPPRRKNQIKDKAKNREENTDKAGQTECKYYLTSEGCRYGKDCKYSHGLDRSSSSHNPEFNFLGLPIRPGEKECPYYMRTGYCKYGLSCRFHHPDPKTVSGGGSPSGYGDAIFPPTQGGTTSTKEWNGYQGSTYPTSEKSLPTPPALAMNNIPTEISLPSQHKRVMEAEEYPERPGEPECSFFLKTGDCKFKSNCKFHHPKSRNAHPKVNSISFSENGLPLRPDQPVCTYYHRYGICKYGPTCKYDHSSNFASMARTERMRHGNETES